MARDLTHADERAADGLMPLAWGVGWTGGALTSGLPGQLVGGAPR